MSNRQITDREKAIIQILVEMGGQSITVSAISEKLELSARTVQRELPGVSRWLDENGVTLEKIRGKGVAIKADKAGLDKINKLLSQENVLPLFSKRERRKNILGRLMFEKEPVKSYVFTSDFAISEGTLFSDLDALEGWMADFKVKIIRKAGTGIYIEGTEVDIRHALSNAVMEFGDINDIPSMLSGLDNVVNESEEFSRQNDPLFVFFTEDIISFNMNVVDEIEKKKGVRFVDSSRIGLIIRGAISIYRLMNGWVVRDLPLELEEYKELTEFASAVRISQAIEGRFGVSVPIEETGYIAIHLSAARIWSDARGFDDPLKSLNVRQVVTSMAAVAERMTNIPFKDDKTLIDDLTNHVLAMKNNVSVDNVFADNRETLQLRRSYPEIYEAAETACQILKEWVAPKELKRMEVALVAIHLMASAERIQRSSQKVAVVVVCPVGIATSKMLAATLERVYPELEIREMMSAFSIDVDKLKRNGIDLIISTTKLNVSFPNIRVSQILQSQDRLLIQDRIDTITRDRIKQRLHSTDVVNAPVSKDTISIEDVSYITAIGTQIHELIENFSIIEISEPISEGELIPRVAEVFAVSDESCMFIEKGLREREEQANTFIPEMGIKLLHCKSGGVSDIRAAYIKLHHPIDIIDGKLMGAMLMLVPDYPESDERVYLGTIGCISTLLVDDPGFLAALKASDLKESSTLIRDALVLFFRDEMNRIGS